VGPLEELPGLLDHARVVGREVSLFPRIRGEVVELDIFVVPSSGGLAVPVVTWPYDDRLLGWTPDGHRILFVSNRGRLAL
jgi:Tol biopolymer transport system component